MRNNLKWNNKIPSHNKYSYNSNIHIYACIKLEITLLLEESYEDQTSTYVNISLL